MEFKNINGSDVTFERDAKISFEESTHTYTVDGVGELTSVSNMIAKFFKDFDADYWSLRKCNGDAEAAAQMREEWKLKGYLASSVGTHMHKQIEQYLSLGQEPVFDCEVEYNGKYIVKHQETVNIAKEWDMFKAFDAATHYRPFRTEWCIFDEDARVGGTIDLVCSCADGTYEIYDWKRSNKIDPNGSKSRSRGINGLDHLFDTPYVHYCLQQNMYRYILEKNYGISISRMNLVVLHPDNANYKVISVPRMDSEVKTMLDRFCQKK